MTAKAGTQGVLPIRGMEAGRRRERVEWGLRFTRDTAVHRKGDVDSRPDEANARECLKYPELGWRGAEVVQRTVVTYTTNWEVPPDGS